MARSVLHVGCGADPLPSWLGSCDETRVDIDAQHSPDIVADMRNLPDIGGFDVLYCSHALEHLSPHEVIPALQGFRRVLKDGGGAIVFVPDLEGVSAIDDVLFNSPAGPISGLDLIYGYRPALEANPYMAHKTGFVSESLNQAMTDAGFKNVAVVRLSDYALMAAGTK
jgi:SAM-dependent methyltransferase